MSFTKKQLFDAIEAGTHQDFFNFRDAMALAGFNTVQGMADYLGVHERTAQRYKEAGTAPRAVMLALRYRAGELSLIKSSHFVGWSIHDDILTSRDGLEYRLADLDELKRQAAQKLRESIENEQLREQVLQLSEQLSLANDRIAALLGYAEAGQGPNVTRLIDKR